MKECYLYNEIDGNKVECLTCAHRCKISQGKKGICGVRKNIEQKLYLLVYGRSIATHVDPIEKKPFHHYLPGTYSLSMATAGCNLRCDNCQNWQISQVSKSKIDISKAGEELLPEEIVKLANKYQCPSISYTYTEPTVYLEYALDTMIIAKEQGIKNIWVSNGYMSAEALDLVIPFLDAANIDLKSFSDKFYQENCGATLAPVLKNLKTLKKRGVWLEVTTLIIPTLSDTEKGLKAIAKFIVEELGQDTPWHVSAFSPAISWKLKEIKPTSYEQVEAAYKIGKDAGLKHVHMGNI